MDWQTAGTTWKTNAFSILYPSHRASDAGIQLSWLREREPVGVYNSVTDVVTALGRTRFSRANFGSWTSDDFSCETYFVTAGQEFEIRKEGLQVYLGVRTGFNGNNLHFVRSRSIDDVFQFLETMHPGKNYHNIAKERY